MTTHSQHLHQHADANSHNVHTCGDCHLHTVHSADVETRLQYAQSLCEAQGVRFTPLRQAVYRLILTAGKPIGAYDLISALQNSRKQSHEDSLSLGNVAPPTVYRSLEFLLAQGLIHQLNSLSAYVPCCHPRASHNAAFLICQNCQQVQEYSSLPIDDLLNFAKQDAQFYVQKSIIELRGLCHECRNKQGNISE
ncbi:MAG: transcriptional repressor [Moraxella sp.]|nr:transcriptional repressor [Moraxella sp.]